MSNVVVPLSGTFRPKGGMTGSILRKASSLAELGHSVQLVTFRYRRDQHEHHEQLVDSGLVSAKVRLVNFFEDLESLQQNKFVEREELIQPTCLIQTKSDEIFRYFNAEGDLLYTDQVVRGKDARLLRRYFDLDISLVRLEERDSDGTLRTVRRYKPGDPNPRSLSYIGRTGAAYLTIWYRHDQSVICVIDHTRSPGQVSPDYNDLSSLQANWFERLVRRTTAATLLIDDPYSFDITRPALSAASRRVLTLHSNTFVQPDDPGSDINGENRKVLDHIDRFDCVVASTNAQCKDLRSRFPSSRFVAIPQLVKVPSGKMVDAIKRDRNLLVYVGRLEPLKQLLELLDSIPPFFDVFPETRFEIYGEGSLEAAIAEKIVGLKLDRHVKLMGSTETPYEVLATANLAVLPTRNEGFGLSIAESMAVGTPVVSFDCRYGPSDMIDSDSGQLVPPQNFEALVATLIELQGDHQRVEAMRPFARRKIEALCGASGYAAAWDAVIASDLTV